MNLMTDAYDPMYMKVLYVQEVLCIIYLIVLTKIKLSTMVCFSKNLFLHKDKHAVPVYHVTIVTIDMG